jgi:hypothetical protein
MIFIAVPSPQASGVTGKTSDHRHPASMMARHYERVAPAQMVFSAAQATCRPQLRHRQTSSRKKKPTQNSGQHNSSSRTRMTHPAGETWEVRRGGRFVRQ